MEYWLIVYRVDEIEKILYLVYVDIFGIWFYIVFGFLFDLLVFKEFSKWSLSLWWLFVVFVECDDLDKNRILVVNRV